MKKTNVAIALALILTLATLFGFSILDNTKAFEIYPLAQITALATPTTVDLRTYERMHVVGQLTAAATTTTVTVKYYKSATSAGAKTLVYTGSAITDSVGWFELEIVKDINYPFVTITLTPSATLTVGVVGILYGKDYAPF